MKISNIVEEDILKCPHGISSYFYSISDNLGIKFFLSKSERDKSKFRQHIAYLANLAPKDGDIYNCGKFYGYITEKVIMLHELYNYINIPQKIEKQIALLEQDLLECCDFEVDLNWRNFGLKNNQLVCVDFGNL